MRETTWTVRGRPFAALEWGDREGLPTVLLHGFLDHAGTWSRVAARLSGWRLALDHRGHGRSPHVGEGDDDAFHTYTFAEYLADLDGLLAQTGPALLVGHSMGGTLASMYAGVRPERVRGLVTVDGLGLVDSSASGPDRMIEFLDGVARLPRNRRFASVAEAAARLRLTHPALDEAWSLELAARGTRPDGDGWTWSWDPRHRLRGPVPYRHDHHAHFLRRVRCPVLVVRPEHSPFADADVERLTGALPPHEVVRVPGAGHMVHLDAPAMLADALASFRARLVN